MCVGGRGFRRPFSFGSTRGDREKQRRAEFLIFVVEQHNTTEYVIDSAEGGTCKESKADTSRSLIPWRRLKEDVRTSEQGWGCVKGFPAS